MLVTLQDKFHYHSPCFSQPDLTSYSYFLENEAIKTNTNIQNHTNINVRPNPCCKFIELHSREGCHVQKTAKQKLALKQRLTHTHTKVIFNLYIYIRVTRIRYVVEVTGWPKIYSVAMFPSQIENKMPSRHTVNERAPFNYPDRWGISKTRIWSIALRRILSTARMFHHVYPTDASEPSLACNKLEKQRYTETPDLGMEVTMDSKSQLCIANMILTMNLIAENDPNTKIQEVSGSHLHPHAFSYIFVPFRITSTNNKLSPNTYVLGSKLLTIGLMTIPYYMEIMGV